MYTLTQCWIDIIASANLSYRKASTYFDRVYFFIYVNSFYLLLNLTYSIMSLVYFVLIIKYSYIISASLSSFQVVPFTPHSLWNSWPLIL